MKIVGAENMSPDQMRFEIQRGAKLVYFQYAISVLVMSFRRSSNIYFIPAGEGMLGKSLPWTFLSLIAGWWGIPWGPIWTIQALITNFQGWQRCDRRNRRSPSASTESGDSHRPSVMI